MAAAAAAGEEDKTDICRPSPQLVLAAKDYYTATYTTSCTLSKIGAPKEGVVYTT
jgi:hypothetical protein